MAFGTKNRIRVQAGVEGVPQATSELGKFRAAFDNVAKSKGAKSILQGVGVGAGVSAWNMVGSAIGGVVDIVGDSVKAASDQREAWSLTQQVFEQNADAMKEWASDTKDAFSTTEAMGFAAEFGTAFKSVGQAIDEVSERSQDMVKLAGDLGSAFNTSSEEAAAALRSGLMGESEPLRKFGVFLSEAAVQAKAAELGIGKLGGKLTDSEKVTARYALIMEQTADSHGMFGRDTDSLADKQKILDTRLADASATLGTKFLPYLQTATESLIDFMDAMAGLPDPGEWWDDATEGAQDFIDTLPKSEYGMDKAARAAARGAKAWDTFAESSAELRGALLETDAAFRHTAATSAHTSDAMRTDARAIKASYIDTADYLLGDYNDSIDTALGIAEARADLHNARTSEDRAEAYADLAALGALGQKGFDDWLGVLEEMAKGTKGKVHEAYQAAIRDVRALKAEAGGRIGISVSYQTPKAGQAPEPRASGGPVLPGRTYTVGEQGQETLVMAPGGGGGFVIPNGGGGGNSGGGGTSTVVHTHINLDGREIARVVDRHLYYEAARAPLSPNAG